MFNEAALELALAELAPIRHAAHRFAGTVARLSWTNKALAHAIAVSARDSTYLLRLTPPNLCTDLQTAEATMRTSKATRTFLQAAKTHSDFGRDEVPTIVALLGPMKPYLSESRREVAELRALDARYQRAFGHITVTAFAKLLRTLLSSTS